MHETHEGETVYAVAEVWRGLASSVQVFRRLEDAERYYKELVASVNMQQDEVRLFETTLQ